MRRNVSNKSNNFLKQKPRCLHTLRKRNLQQLTTFDCFQTIRLSKSFCGQDRVPVVLFRFRHRSAIWTLETLLESDIASAWIADHVGKVITDGDRGKASEQRPPIARASSTTGQMKGRPLELFCGESDLDVIAMRSATVFVQPFLLPPDSRTRISCSCPALVCGCLHLSCLITSESLAGSPAC